MEWLTERHYVLLLVAEARLPDTLVARAADVKWVLSI